MTGDAGSTADWDSDDQSPLVIDGGSGGNLSCKFNDCRLDPFTAPRRGTVRREGHLCRSNVL
jgi:hypothetical protein